MRKSRNPGYKTGIMLAVLALGVGIAYMIFKKKSVNTVSFTNAPNLFGGYAGVRVKSSPGQFIRL